MKKTLVLLSLTLTFASLVACRKNTETPPTGTATPKVVNLASWSNYVAPETIAEFEKKTGYKVQVSNYSSNEELLAKLQAGASGWDVAIPSDYMVSVMAKVGVIQPLDYAQLSNKKNVDPKFLKRTYDPENKYSLPYTWGTTGIFVNGQLYSGKIKGWKDLFNNPDLVGKYTLLDDVRETVGAALMSLGYSINSIKPDELAQAKALLIQQRKRIKAFTSEANADLESGVLGVAHVFQGDGLRVKRALSNGKSEYIIPEEGATLWVDNLVIPNGAQNLEGAHALIQFLLEPTSSLATVRTIMVAPANTAVFALLPPEYQKDSALYPDAKVMSRLQMIEDLGDNIGLWDRLWTEVKSQRD